MKSQAFDRASHLIADAHRVGQIQAGKQHCELLAPDTRNEITGAQRRLETSGNALQNAVPRAMPVAVVDELEIIDIPQQGWFRVNSMQGIGAGVPSFNSAEHGPMCGACAAAQRAAGWGLVRYPVDFMMQVPSRRASFALGFAQGSRKKMVFKISFSFATLLLASTVVAQPRIYTYLDGNGLRHYTDVPDNNRYRLLVLSPHDRTASGDRYDARLLAKAGQYDSIIEKAAVAASLEPNLLRAVIVVESGFNSRAVSKRGAVGLMQLMPATAARYGVANRYDPLENVHAGARYLKFLMDRFGQDVRLALAAYNAGEDAVERNGGQIPPFTETMAYVPRVLRIYQMLREAPRST